MCQEVIERKMKDLQFPTKRLGVTCRWKYICWTPKTLDAVSDKTFTYNKSNQGRWISWMWADDLNQTHSSVKFLFLMHYCWVEHSNFCVTNNVCILQTSYKNFELEEECLKLFLKWFCLNPLISIGTKLYKVSVWKRTTLYISTLMKKLKICKTH